MTAAGIFDNEASSVDLKVYDELRALGWSRESKTLLYQPKYDLSPEEQADFPGSRHIKPDFVLQDLQGVPLAVIENKLEDPNKALVKLRMKYSRVLRPRFLYACSANKMLFYDMAWRGVDAGEFKPVNVFLSLEEMKQKIQQEQRRSQGEKIAIDTTIAGGYDPAAGKERYYQLECIKVLIEAYRTGKQKMLVHMATGLGKTRVIVALTKALLGHGLAKRVLFVVDRRFLARQAIQKGFSLISPAYNATWITSANFKANKGKDIHVVVIDTLELLYKAGRLMLKEIAEYSRHGTSFAFETTLAGKTYARMIPNWQAEGYHVKLFFLELPSAEMAIARVAERVRQGGHNVPEEVIRRRFSAGRKNFDLLYRDLVDSWALYHNAGDEPQLIDWSEK